MNVLNFNDLAREALGRANELVSKAALTAVRPIYRNTGTRPEHLGTVTFVTVDGVDYALTAAHVVDHHKEHTLFIGHRRLQGLTLNFHTTVAPELDRRRDRWDFSFAKVDAGWRESGILPFDLSELPPLDDAQFFTAVGYPNSANRKVDHQARTIQPTQRRYSGARLPRDHPLYSNLGLSPATHIAINRDPKRALCDGKRVNAFEPRGMSGGVFFALTDVWRSGAIFGGAPTIVPAGLIIEKSDRHRALFGPALAVVVDQIRAIAAR